MKKNSVRAFDVDGCGGDAGLGHCLASWDPVSVWWERNYVCCPDEAEDRCCGKLGLSLRCDV